MQLSLKGELKVLLDQFMKSQGSSLFSNLSQDREKGILGESSLGLQAREGLRMTSQTKIGTSGTKSRFTGAEISNRYFKSECPRFDGPDFRGWWSKLEQYFEIWLK